MSNRYCVSGCHSQGKSTLVEYLQSSKITALEGYEFSSSMTRQLQKEGVVINEGGDGLTQLKVLTKFYERFLSSGENFIHDRCALDGMAYTHVLYESHKISSHIYRACLSIFEELLPKYDKIFYVVPELGLVDDGVRTVNEEFFDRTRSAFDYHINLHNIDVVKLYGSVEDRAGMVLEYIDTKNNPFRIH